MKQFLVALLISGGLAQAMFGQPQTFDIATFVSPRGWSQTRSNGILIVQNHRMVQGRVQFCQIYLFPSQPSNASATANFQAEWDAKVARKFGVTSRNAPQPTINPDGWILLVARVDSQIATIVGTSKDFMVSNCFGLLRGDLWPKFFSTLQFKNARPSGPEHTAIQQQLAGRWITATGSAGLQYTFDANGRYADTVATQYRTPISSNEVLQTTTAFFGNGGYSFDGNMLLLKRDDNKRFAFLFRLEQVSKDSGRTWADELCLMETGSTGEVCYRKE